MNVGQLLQRRQLRDLHVARQLMVRRLAAAGFGETVLGALAAVPRHAFLPTAMANLGYLDRQILTGSSLLMEPNFVATALDAIGPLAGRRVLEIGTGAGYQTALLVHAGARVFSLDIKPQCTLASREAFEDLEIDHSVVLGLGDGREGWAAHAPFDAIVVDAAVGVVPPALVRQLDPARSVLVAPVGSESQQRITVIEQRSGSTRVIDRGRGSYPPLQSLTPGPVRALTRPADRPR